MKTVFAGSLLAELSLFPVSYRGGWLQWLMASLQPLSPTCPSRNNGVRNINGIRWEKAVSHIWWGCLFVFCELLLNGYFCVGPDRQCHIACGLFGWQVCISIHIVWTLGQKKPNVPLGNCWATAKSGTIWGCQLARLDMFWRVKKGEKRSKSTVFGLY